MAELAHEASYALGLAGGSGAIYGVHLLRALLEAGARVHLVATPAAFRVLRHEVGLAIADEASELLGLVPAGLRARLTVHDVRAVEAAPASGSAGIRATVICPCSMGTLARVAHGFSSNLVERMADVAIKEGRPLIVVPRETPLSKLHLRNMLALAELGAVVLPAMPGFYHRPRSVEDLVEFVVGKVLDRLGIASPTIRRWQTPEANPGSPWGRGRNVKASLAAWFALVRFSHSVFALPFALSALLVATNGRPGARVLALVVAAVVAARTAAMAFNRYLDRTIDAANPRTAGREIPRGVIRPAEALTLTFVAGAIFVGLASALSPLCGWLALPVLGLLLGYSWAKRFTALSHVWLGAALGLAPPAAHLAARGSFDASLLAPSLLGLGVVFWVAGFDIVYSLQDLDFDEKRGLHSIPVRFGVPGALRIAAGCHAAALPLFFAFGWLGGLGWVYPAGVAVIGLVLASEHRLVRGGDLTRIDAAFFQRNAIVSLSLLLVTALDLYLL